MMVTPSCKILHLIVLCVSIVLSLARTAQGTIYLAEGRVRQCVRGGNLIVTFTATDNTDFIPTVASVGSVTVRVPNAQANLVRFSGQVLVSNGMTQTQIPGPWNLNTPVSLTVGTVTGIPQLSTEVCVFPPSAGSGNPGFCRDASAIVGCTGGKDRNPRIPNREPGQRLPAPPPRFELSNNGTTVIDNQTGLMWERKTGTSQGTPGQGVNLNQPSNVNNRYISSGVGSGSVYIFLGQLNGVVCATATCPSLGGYSDWRLPTLSELQTIVDRTQGFCGNPSSGAGAGPCIRQDIFGPTKLSFYWSSSFSQANTSWMASFGGGPDGQETNTFENYVRAVRRFR